jgi:hypothetical protein
MAHGLPIEGTDAGRTTAVTLLRQDVAICGLADSGEEVARRIDASRYGFALALSPGRVVLGRVRRSRLADAGANVEALLEPGPSTIRPAHSDRRPRRPLGSVEEHGRPEEQDRASLPPF